MTSDIVGELRQFCTDWDGSTIPRDAEPMDGIHCRLLMDAADEIECLRKELDMALNDRAGAIGAIADIRMKTGVGVKPMLDELADAIVAKIDEARFEPAAEAYAISALCQALKPFVLDRVRFDFSKWDGETKVYIRLPSHGRETFVRVEDIVKAREVFEVISKGIGCGYDEE